MASVGFKGFLFRGVTLKNNEDSNSSSNSTINKVLETEVELVYKKV